MSEIKVNKLTPRVACGTTTLGDSGDTFNIPAGVTISNNGTATGFGATGAVSWDVASIKTVDFTAASGVGYFVDTATTGAVIVTLPAAPAVGDVVGVADYANNFNTANCTLNRNGLKIGGQTVNGTMTVDGVALTLVYVDVTQGWIVTDSGNQSDAEATVKYVTATSPCVTTSGDYKIHKFTGPGSFVVTCGGNAAGSNTVSYVVIAGGGGGGYYGGGGGAGGYRESKAASDSYTASPLNATSGPGYNLPVSATPYPITVGGGGPGGPGSGNPGTKGNDSIFSSITSTGGGFGGGGPTSGNAGGPGGSGGAAAPDTPSGGGTIGSGNTPPTTPAQGQNSGESYHDPGQYQLGGGGGGAGAVGGSVSPGPGPGATAAGAGGAGVATSITASPVTRAGGGGGGSDNGPRASGAAGPGGGGTGGHDPSPSPAATTGTINTGGGGGGGGQTVGAAGGSGIVIIRYKFQN